MFMSRMTLIGWLYAGLVLVGGLSAQTGYFVDDFLHTSYGWWMTPPGVNTPGTTEKQGWLAPGGGWRKICWDWAWPGGGGTCELLPENVGVSTTNELLLCLPRIKYAAPVGTSANGAEVVRTSSTGYGSYRVKMSVPSLDFDFNSGSCASFALLVPGEAEIAIEFYSRVQGLIDHKGGVMECFIRRLDATGKIVETWRKSVLLDFCPGFGVFEYGFDRRSGQIDFVANGIKVAAVSTADIKLPTAAGNIRIKHWSGDKKNCGLPLHQPSVGGMNPVYMVIEKVSYSTFKNPGSGPGPVGPPGSAGLATWLPFYDTFNRTWASPDKIWHRINWIWNVPQWSLVCAFIPALVKTWPVAQPEQVRLTCRDFGSRAEGGWLESNNRTVYGAYRARFKTSSPNLANLNHGCCNAFFHYGPYGEIDMELRSRWQGTIYPGVLDLVVHRNDGKGKTLASFHHPLFLPFDPSAEFHDYGFDWRPGRVDFFVDSELVYTFTGTASVPVPSANGTLHLNCWAGMPFWGGIPEVGGRDFSVDWVCASPDLFTTDKTSVSASSGGCAQFNLDGGKSKAGDFYLLLGGVSGSNRSVMLAGYEVPIEWDVATGALLLAGSLWLGQFDGNGQAVNKGFTLPQGAPAAMVGSSFSFAYLVIDSTTLSVISTSTPLRVGIRK